MNRLMLTLGAAASAMTLSVSPALAQDTPRNTGKVTYTECRKSPGTTGLAIGGVAGALAGGGIFGGILGPILGGIGGAFAGQAIDRDSTKSKRCRLVREAKTYQREETYETSWPNERYEPGRYDAQQNAPQQYAPQPYNDGYGTIREEDRDLVQPERY
jgi:uncharacterized protein YcfJ